MGIMGSAFGRALAGAGASVSSLADKYIDQDLQMQRATALEELRRQTATNIRTDEDAFNSDPTRVARNRANKVADITATGTATNEVALQGKLNEAKNTDLSAAEVARANALLKGTTQTRIDVENDITTGTSAAKLKVETDRAAALLPLEVKRAYALADAQASATARHREARVQPGEELLAKVAATEKLLGRALTEPEKIGLLGLGAKGRDPELDTATVVTEKINPDGTTVKTTHKEVRRPGGEKAPEADPVKAAMDAARAAKDGKPGAAAGSIAEAARNKVAARTSGEMNMDAAAAKAGYTFSKGNDGKDYYSRSVNGQGEILSPKQLADRLGLLY